MSSIYDAARESFLKGLIDFSTDSIRAKLVSTAYTYSASHSTVADVAASTLSTSPALTSKTTTAGVANAASVTFTAVPGGADGKAIVLYQHVAGDNTDKIICYIDQTSDSSLPVTPNGGDIIVNWDTGANKIFKL